jgi:hypothetical protein
MFMAKRGTLLFVTGEAYKRASRSVPPQKFMAGRFFGTRYVNGRKEENQCRREPGFCFITLTFYQSTPARRFMYDDDDDGDSATRPVHDH